jgi:hypothetical protein
LEDLSATRTIAPHPPIPPDRPQCEAIVTALARVHEAWWNNPRLVERMNALPEAEFFGPISERVAAFRERLGDRLSL